MGTTPELLSPQAASTLTVLIADQPLGVTQNVLLSHSDVLKRCRDVGVGRAFAEKTAPLRVVPAQLMKQLRDAQAAEDKRLLITLLREHPELRPALKHRPGIVYELISPPSFDEAMQQIARLKEAEDSSEEGHQQLIAACRGILSRLREEPHPAFQAVIENDLGSAYARMGDFDQAVECYQAALLAGAHEADRRHIGFLAVVENELTTPAARIEVLPPHQAAAPRRLAVDGDDLDLITDEISREHGRDDVAWEAPGSTVGDRRGAQRKALRLLQAPLLLEKLLQPQSDARFVTAR